MLFVNKLTRSKISEKFLQGVAEKALINLPKLVKDNKKSEIELVIIGEKKMRSLNRDWRGKDKVTDVLSFGSQKSEFIDAPDGVVRLGQIFICASVAARQAREYGCSIQEETSRLLVHGILHLAGYDHEKNIKEEKKMMDLQRKILKK